MSSLWKVRINPNVNLNWVCLSVLYKLHDSKTHVKVKKSTRGLTKSPAL